MTRLNSKDVCGIEASLEDYNYELISKTGHGLGQIAAHAVEAWERDVYRNAAGVKIAIIPMTCGLGVIGGFAQSVESIVNFLGFNAFVTNSTDAGGMAEAVEKCAGVLMMADDHRFVAVNLITGKVVDNGEATGRGYVAALELMAGGLKNKEVLLVGSGPVGTGAAMALAGLGAQLSVYDINESAGNKLVCAVELKYDCHVGIESDLDQALHRHSIIFDASPARAFIKGKHITGETFIAAPGMPLGVSAGCLSRVRARLMHDPLQIGVATMIFDAFKV